MKKIFLLVLYDNFMVSDWCERSVFLFTFVTQDKSESHAARADKEVISLCDELKLMKLSVEEISKGDHS